MSDLTPEAVSQLVQQQLEQVSNSVVHEAISAMLVPPALHYRQWIPEATDEKIPCWTVGEDPASGTDYIYCANPEPLSPNIPWAIVGRNDNYMGMDSNWFESLERAFYDSWASEPLPIWCVVKNNSSGENRVIAIDLTHEQAWELLGKLDPHPEMPEDARSYAIYSIEPRTQKWW